jgi:hypothetical protein
MASEDQTPRSARERLLREAAGSRSQANRFRQAAAFIADDVVEKALLARAVEFEVQAQKLEAEAAALPDPQKPAT